MLTGSREQKRNGIPQGRKPENPISLYGQQGDNLGMPSWKWKSRREPWRTSHKESSKYGGCDSKRHAPPDHGRRDANVAAIIEAFYLSAAENREVRADELEQFA